MIHHIKDHNGNTIMLCGDKVFETIMNIPSDKVNEYLNKWDKADYKDFNIEGHTFSIKDMENLFKRNE